MIPRLGGMTLSVLLHAGLVGLLLAWSATDWPRPLFVDLDLVERLDPGEAPAGAPAPAGSTPPAARAAAAAPGPALVAPRPGPDRPAVAVVAPPPAPVPPVLPPAEPPAAPQLLAEASPAPAPSPAAVPAPPAPSGSPPPSTTTGVRGAAPDAGSVARAGAPVRGDADAGPGSAPGSPLALAVPGPGGGAGAMPAEYGPYLRGFRQRVLEGLVYPLAARRQGLGGTVELHVWLEPTGRVREVQVARSSSHPILDDAAVEAIRRLGPVPFPETLPRRPLLIRVPLVFELR
jgi:TonB family protein